MRTALDDLPDAAGSCRPGPPAGHVPGAEWAVPSGGWHVDFYGPEHDLPGVTVFASLAPVRPRGGGTVLISGSRRLVNRRITTTGSWRPAEIWAALHSAEPWLERSCFDRLAVVGDVEVWLAELTGALGDVVPMYPRALQAAAAPNAGPRHGWCWSNRPGYTRNVRQIDVRPAVLPRFVSQLGETVAAHQAISAIGFGPMLVTVWTSTGARRAG